MIKGNVIKENDKLLIEYKKDLFDGIFFYYDYYTKKIEIKENNIDLKEGDKVLFEIETISDGTFLIDKDIAKIITKI